MNESHVVTDVLVAVIILNWNNAADTLACLGSVLQSDYPNYHILVVDNGSTDDSVERIRAAYPNIELLETGANLGYAGGNNVGIRRALEQGTDYVWLVNDDALVAPDCLSRLMAAAAERADAGFLGPMVRTREQPQIILSTGGMLDAHFQASFRGLGEINREQYSQVGEVDYLSGCALLVSRRAIEAIGLLDEAFFAYEEDVEWCYRGGRAGFKSLFVPQALVWHPDTRLRDANSARVMYYMSRNHLLFLRRHRAGWRAMARVLCRYVIWLANWSLNPKQRSARRKRDALWLAVRDYALGRFGKSKDL